MESKLPTISRLRRWPDVLRSISSMRYVADFEYFETFCYFRRIVNFCSSVALLARGAFEIDLDVVESIHELIEMRRKADASLIEQAKNLAVIKRDRLVFLFTERYSDAKRNRLGDIFHLLLRQIELELSEEDEISRVVKNFSSNVCREIRSLYPCESYLSP
ncbi:hypothetical protein RF11_13623 [Thelohanellus kitauei]|uniref:Uncharacterized protein n=1 Tax=Thelohanellus kitauei TaxID=669202 RepID=A0A0C2M6D5_THEKT|nr:hypothetical protein RF11_13623 [Thelohanellus kitauei]